MKFIKHSQVGNYIITHAVGGEYESNWLNNSFDSWMKYSQIHDIGIILFNERPTNSNGKNIYWDKFLFAKELEKYDYVKNICYLDTDVIINPYSPNIFSAANINKINLISQKNIPYISEYLIRKKIYH